MAQTDFAKLNLYDAVTDAQEKFLKFRDDLCGTKPDSSMNKIDALLSSQSKAGVHNATCTYSNSVYSLTLADTSVTISDDIFTLRFLAPNDFEDGRNFTFGGVTYTAIDTDFSSGQVILFNFDKSAKRCYSAGAGKSTAATISRW